MKHLVPADRNGRSIRYALAGKAGDQQAFPAPVSPEHHNDFPGVYLEIEPPIIRSITDKGEVANGKWKRLSQGKVR